MESKNEEKNVKKSTNNIEDIKEYDEEKEYTADEIMNRIMKIKNIENKDYEFEWNVPNGLRFLSDNTIDIICKILEKGNCKIKEVERNDKSKLIEFNSNVTTICFISKENAIEKLDKNEVVGLNEKFTYSKYYYDNNVCVGCKYDRCPKFYAGYIIYLKNKGLLPQKLQDREEFRKNTFKSDYFTFKWETKKGTLSTIPEKTFEFCMELLNRGLVHVMPGLTEQGHIKIYEPFTCKDFAFMNDDTKRLPNQINKYEKWYYYTRSHKELLKFCDGYSCRLDACTGTIAGYLYYLKRCGREKQIEEERKYYNEHKDEIEKQNQKERQEKLESLEKLTNENIKELKKFKYKIKNIENLINNIRIWNQKNLHITLEGNDLKIKEICENKIIDILKNTDKVRSAAYRKISLQNIAAENTYIYTSRTDVNGNKWPVYDATTFKPIQNDMVFIITGIKEFVNDYKLYKNIPQSEYKEIRNKQFEHTIDMLTDLSSESYIILDSTQEEIDELIELNPKLKFVFQENRYKVEDTSIDEMFEIYLKDIKPELLEELRIKEKEIKTKFVEYVGMNKEFVPFSEIEFARYLAAYNNSRNDFVFPANVYKKETVDESLENIIGMQKVKEKVKEFEKYALFTIKAKTLGMKLQKSNLHMVFTGNPGTGKTMVARIMAKMLYDLGLIKENKLVEVERKDLVAAYIGQTAIKTSEILEKAMGGVLFIDEAYTLYNKAENDFGKEAISTIIKTMEDKKDEIVIIFAGYRDEMFDFLKINPGIKSRIGYTFDFLDYTSNELTQMFVKKTEKMGFTLESGVEKKINEICEYFTGKKSFGNGRFIDKLIQEVIINHAVNSSKEVKKIVIKDIPNIEELNNSNSSGKTATELMENLIGMKEIKEKLKEFEAYISFLKEAKENNIKIPKQNIHMVFTGNSGTGKTTVARIVAEALYDLGVIHENKLVEVERKDLVAEYVGQTAIKTANVIEKAMGGVLFIDEAYTLYNKSESDFGQEALATIIKAMEDKKDEIVIIFAGYKKEMQNFMAMNSGVFSRIGYTFDFPDYDENEYCEIFYKKIESANMKLEEDAKENVLILMKYFHNVENIGNGRFVDKVMQETLMKHAKNKERKIDTIKKEEIPTIQEMTKQIFNGNYMIDPSRITNEDKKEVAIHEVGHALLRYLLFETPGIKKIVIDAEGTGTLGYVSYNEETMKYTSKKSEILNRIMVSMGGMAAEKVYLGEFANGNSSDLEKATELAKNMVATYGMSELGYGQIKNPDNRMSEIMQNEINKILEECFEKTQEKIEQNKEKMDKIIAYLMEKTEIDEEEFIKVYKEKNS